MGVDRPEEDDLPRPDDTPSEPVERTGRVAVEDRDRFEYYDALRAAVDGGSADTWTAAKERFSESWAEHCERWPQEARKPPDRSADPPGSWRGDSGRYLDSAANVEVEERCDQIADIERTVITPAMREIESSDPNRHLAGLDHRLKGQDRLKDKIAAEISEKGRTAAEALMMAKDAIRYTFVYSDDHYIDGVAADVGRLEAQGFRQAERRNTWVDEQYKGINGRWRAPDSGQVFEVQFHTEASYEAKQLTHCAYERTRDPVTTRAELRELRRLQGDVCRQILMPPGASEIPDYP
jgi:hypothetical protein